MKYHLQEYVSNILLPIKYIETDFQVRQHYMD